MKTNRIGTYWFYDITRYLCGFHFDFRKHSMIIHEILSLCTPPRNTPQQIQIHSRIALWNERVMLFIRRCCKVHTVDRRTYDRDSNYARYGPAVVGDVSSECSKKKKTDDYRWIFRTGTFHVEQRLSVWKIKSVPSLHSYQTNTRSTIRH